MELIDTHAHLYDPKFADDLPATIARSQAAGVCRIYMPNIDLQTIAPMRRVATAYSNLCKPMIGLHPCAVKEGWQQTLSILEKELQQHTFYAIGEVGMDFYHGTLHAEAQRQALHVQIEWARAYRLPLVLHTRACIDEVLAILNGYQGAALKGVFHCFTGTLEQAKQIVDLGFLLGIGGILTYPRQQLQEVVTTLPLSSFILETDAPYLAPVPHRGKRNEPSYLLHIAQAIATLRAIPLHQVVATTTANAETLFAS